MIMLGGVGGVELPWRGGGMGEGVGYIKDSAHRHTHIHVHTCTYSYIHIYTHIRLSGLYTNHQCTVL